MQNFEVIKEKILPWLDLYLMDIKHISSAKHKLFTGQPNGRILAQRQKDCRKRPEADYPGAGDSYL